MCNISTYLKIFNFLFYIFSFKKFSFLMHFISFNPTICWRVLWALLTGRHVVYTRVLCFLFFDFFDFFDWLAEFCMPRDFPFSTWHYIYRLAFAAHASDVNVGRCRHNSESFNHSAIKLNFMLLLREDVECDRVECAKYAYGMHKFSNVLQLPQELISLVL